MTTSTPTRQPCAAHRQWVDEVATIGAVMLALRLGDVVQMPSLDVVAARNVARDVARQLDAEILRRNG